MEDTVKLYDMDAYATEFCAKVVSFNIEENGYEVVLDKTLFFPEEGGQNCDTGYINDFKVIDVQIKDGVITHLLDKTEKSLIEAIQTGCSVKGKIDWEMRFSNMQNHTGEHILSGLIHQKYGYNNVGFHLSPQIVTMDIDGFLTEEDVFQIEQEANEAVYKNVDVMVSYPDKEELQMLDYRSKIEIDGLVRIVTVQGYDICACCAPHVKRTGEIGCIKVIRCDKYKQGVRLTILCGKRAMDYFRMLNERMSESGNLLSANAETLPDEIKRLIDEKANLKAVISDMQLREVKQKVNKISANQDDVIVFESEIDSRAQREYVNLLTEKCSGICAIFAGTDKTGYKFIIGSKNKDTRQISNLLREKLGARGGGKAEMVQGSVVADRLDIEQIFSIFQLQNV